MTEYVGKHRKPEPAIHEQPHDDWSGRHGRIASCPPEPIDALLALLHTSPWLPVLPPPPVPFGFIQTRSAA